MFLDLLNQPLQRGDLILHIDKIGAVLGVVDWVSDSAVHYEVLHRPSGPAAYLVRKRDRVVKLELNSTTCNGKYPVDNVDSKTVEEWLDLHAQHGRSSQ